MQENYCLQELLEITTSKCLINAFDYSKIVKYVIESVLTTTNTAKCLKIINTPSGKAHYAKKPMGAEFPTNTSRYK